MFTVTSLTSRSGLIDATRRAVKFPRNGRNGWILNANKRPFVYFEPSVDDKGAPVPDHAGFVIVGRPAVDADTDASTPDTGKGKGERTGQALKGSPVEGIPNMMGMRLDHACLKAVYGPDAPTPAMFVMICADQIGALCDGTRDANGGGGASSDDLAKIKQAIEYLRKFVADCASRSPFVKPFLTGDNWSDVCNLAGTIQQIDPDAGDRIIETIAHRLTGGWVKQPNASAFVDSLKVLSGILETGVLPASIQPAQPAPDAGKPEEQGDAGKPEQPASESTDGEGEGTDEQPEQPAQKGKGKGKGKQPASV